MRRETSKGGKERGRTWIAEGREREKLQASQAKRCGDRGPTYKKNSSDQQAMARASSSPRLCLPQLLLVVIAAVFVALPAASCASLCQQQQ